MRVKSFQALTAVDSNNQLANSTIYREISNFWFFDGISQRTGERLAQSTCGSGTDFSSPSPTESGKAGQGSSTAHRFAVVTRCATFGVPLLEASRRGIRPSGA